MNMKAVLGLIMGGGQGSRLYPLTKLRAKPAVPLAGKYRLIDIPISNCLHAGIDKIAMGADYYETEADRAENKRLGRPDIGIDEGTVIEGAIIDKNARIGRNVHVPALIRPPRQRNGQLGGPRRPGGYPEGRGN
jgi:ADP-glucose pyrophosphorylase